MVPAGHQFIPLRLREFCHCTHKKCPDGCSPVINILIRNFGEINEPQWTIFVFNLYRRLTHKANKKMRTFTPTTLLPVLRKSDRKCNCHFSSLFFLLVCGWQYNIPLDQFWPLSYSSYGRFILQEIGSAEPHWAYLIRYHQMCRIK